MSVYSRCTGSSPQSGLAMAHQTAGQAIELGASASTRSVNVPLEPRQQRKMAIDCIGWSFVNPTFLSKIDNSSRISAGLYTKGIVGRGRQRGDGPRVVSACACLYQQRFPSASVYLVTTKTTRRVRRPLMPSNKQARVLVQKAAAQPRPKNSRTGFAMP